jgi:hypothetical protein
MWLSPPIEVLNQVCIIHLVLFILSQTWRKIKKKIIHVRGHSSHRKVSAAEVYSSQIRETEREREIGLKKMLYITQHTRPQITNLLIPRSRFLNDKLIVPKLGTNPPHFVELDSLPCAQEFSTCSILTQNSLVGLYTTSAYFFNTNFSITLPYAVTSSKWYIPFRCPTKIHTYHKTGPSCSHSIDHPTKPLDHFVSHSTSMLQYHT